MQTRLWAEALGLFVLAPMAVAVLLPATMIFPMLFGFTLVGVWLLVRTPEFAWRDLWHGADQIGWLRMAGWSMATLLCASAVMLWTAPNSYLSLPRTQPGLFVMVALLYPLLSALPQELVFRPLFFRRYARILPGALWPRIILNAAVFSLAHLMYWSPIVAAMTFSGGLIFAHSYEARRNFPEAVVLHSLSGIIVFAVGLGIYFYSGNVERPF